VAKTFVKQLGFIKINDQRNNKNVKDIRDEHGFGFKPGLHLAYTYRRKVGFIQNATAVCSVGLSKTN